MPTTTCSTPRGGGGDAQFRAFADTWSWDQAAAVRFEDFAAAVARPAHQAIVGFHKMLGTCGMLAYLTYMAERLEELHRLLKSTGAIYLHCDPTASHSLKLLMDSIFGVQSFRNEIIWCYPPKGRGPSKAFHRKHDTLLYYNKSADSNDGTFTRPYSPLDDKQRAKFYAVDNDGRHYKPFKGKRTYLDESKGRPVPSWWDDIAATAQSSTEYLGYPTQKPLKLLRRIVETSSNRGDIVLDPFCGCGSAIEAARSTGRQFIGIDISSHAIDVMLDRLRDRTISTYGIPADLQSAERMAKTDPFGFETWAVNRIHGFAANTKQVADGGVDGRGTLALKPDDWESRLALAQVKSGKHTASYLRDFCGVTQQHMAAVGVYITLRPVDTPASKSDSLALGSITVSGQQYRRMNLWSIAEYFDNRPPNLPQMNNPYTGKPLTQLSMF